jgi:hypothetical protein
MCCILLREHGRLAHSRQRLWNGYTHKDLKNVLSSHLTQHLNSVTVHNISSRQDGITRVLEAKNYGTFVSEILHLV